MKNIILEKIKKLINTNGYVYYKRSFMPFGLSVWDDMRRLSPGCANKVLFDVGANVGQTYTEMRNKNHDAMIYCFEPSRSPYEALEEITRQDRLTKTFHTAVGEENGECLIQARNDSVWNKIVEIDNSSSGENIETVTKITVDHIIEQEQIDNIYLLKTDTEGYDLFVLKGAYQALLKKRISFILTEVTFRSDDKQRSHFSDIFEYLSSFGYNLICLYDLSIVGKPKSLEFCNALFINR